MTALRNRNLRPHVLAMVFPLLILVLSGAFAQEQVGPSTGLDELKSLADSGNSDAMMELGERYMEGRGVETNMETGITWIQKAADAGNDRACYGLGMAAANGIGMETNMMLALGYLLKGASLGNADCQCSLGMFYQAGERLPGVLKGDPAEARTWYRRAAEQDHQEAILHLGQLYMFGQGGEADPVEAARWFRKGAESGNHEAQWALGKCYLQGKGVDKDPVQAYGLMSAASARASNPQQKTGMSEQCSKVAQELTQEQLAEGKQLAEEWKARVSK